MQVKSNKLQKKKQDITLSNIKKLDILNTPVQRPEKKVELSWLYFHLFFFTYKENFYTKTID